MPDAGRADDGRAGGLFWPGEVKPRRQARRYVCGLISDLPQKNCWALAEQAGDATPDRMHGRWNGRPGMRLMRCARYGRSRCATWGSG